MSPSLAADNESDALTSILEDLKQIKDELAHTRSELAVIKNAVTEIHRSQILPKQAVAAAAENVESIAIGGHDIVIGDTSAGLAIIEYSEFQCPYCARFNSATFDTIKEKYIDAGKVAYIPREFPLEFHDQAKPASIFALCANEQNEYWTVRNALFAAQRQLGNETYDLIANDTGLDLDLLDKCMQNNEVAAYIDSSVSDGKALGVSGTPTFFIGKIIDGKLVNPKRVVGAQPISVFRDTLDGML